MGNEGFRQIFQRFNEEPRRLGLLSRQMCADSSLVRANVSERNLYPSGMSLREFRDRAVEENGLFVLRKRGVGKDGEDRRNIIYYQDTKGRLPWSPVGTDARWRTTRHDKCAHLHYQGNAIVERGGIAVNGLEADAD